MYIDWNPPLAAPAPHAPQSSTTTLLVDAAGKLKRVAARAARRIADHPYATLVDVLRYAVGSGSLKAHRLQRAVMARRGELSAVIAAIAHMRRIHDAPHLADDERRWIGRMVETDPRWVPRIPGPPRPLVPRGPAVVMHLFKYSVPYRQNGFSLRSHYTLRAQRDAGLEPFVVTSLGFPRNDGTEQFPATERIDGTVQYRLDLGPGYSPKVSVDQQLKDAAWLAARIARAERPAIIHAHSGFRGFELALVGLALRDHLQRPLVYEVRSFQETSWAHDPEYAEGSEHTRRRCDAEDRCMRAADITITLGEVMRDQIEARGVPAERIRVVPNGVDTSAFEPSVRDVELVRRYQLDGKFVFGYVGNLDHPREGLELLVEATSRLITRGRNVVCLIVGDGRRRDGLQQTVRRARVGHAVRFTGLIPHREIRTYYSLLDAFVLPRRDERASRAVTPLKPFEAMAMGLPLVVSNLPALVEVAAPGQRGLAFKAHAPDALASALERLIDNRDLGRDLGAAGRRWVVAERSWARNGERYRDIYAELHDRWQRDRR